MPHKYSFRSYTISYILYLIQISEFIQNKQNDESSSGKQNKD